MGDLRVRDFAPPTHRLTSSRAPHVGAGQEPLLRGARTHGPADRATYTSNNPTHKSK